MKDADKKTLEDLQKTTSTQLDKKVVQKIGSAVRNRASYRRITSPCEIFLIPVDLQAIN